MGVQPYEYQKTIDLAKAQEIAKKAGKDVSHVTLLKWIKDNKLGHQPAGKHGRWHIFEDSFTRFIYGNNDAATEK